MPILPRNWKQLRNLKKPLFMQTIEGHMKSEETVRQSGELTDRQFILHLIILYGSVILILGFVWGMMIIK
jgi:hypothetical protein